MPLKKVLISFVDNFLILSYIEREFKKYSVEVDFFTTNNSGHWINRFFYKKINKLAKSLHLLSDDGDLFRWSKFSIEPYRDSMLSKKIAQFHPDLILCIQGHQVGKNVLKNIKIPKIGWLVEPNPNLEDLIEFSSLFDLYLSYDSEVVDLLKSHQINADYQSHVAFDADFFPIPNIEKDIDVLFYGSWSPWREEVLFAAYQATNNIALYGSDWVKNCRFFSKNELQKILKGKEIVGDQLNRIMNRSKIVLGIQRLKKATTGLDTRAFDVLASGSLLLTDAPKDLFRHFRDKKDLIIYENTQQVMKAIEAILSDQIKVDSIRQSGREVVLKQLTYKNFCQKILDFYSQITRI